ncbi:MAG: dynamin family protein [Candidatus Eremiobacteraeota bacterium]|nr:dynamin family protein [Candidatus Eremiobacteraeota bacterium]MBC5803889.1 dynamin family protein [Candidatus Eremiobacteraeota bacterium]MBC5821387.1 dynamin family protein [Candidatus Eremiobacteraeota bacterium]
MPAIPAALSAALDGLEAVLESDARAGWPAPDDDLSALRAARERLSRRYALAVVGEFSSGKSYLLNALLGKVRYDERGRIEGVLATDINPSTATITELEYGQHESAYATYPSGRSERIPLDRLSRFVAVARNDAPGAVHDATADEDAGPSFVVVTLDSPFLRGGFVVADTPGLASPNAAHRRATLGYLPRVDAVLYLIDTQQPFSEGDAAFLGLIGEHVRTIFIVQTKIDLWRMPEADGRPAWEAARERIVARAARFAPQAEVFAVSAHDYALATLQSDERLAEGSGFSAMLASLECSLEARAQAARIARTLALARQIAASNAARIARAAMLVQTAPADLERERRSAETELAEHERALSRARDDIELAGTARGAWIAAAGTTVREDAGRALATMIDVADIERIRDRGKLHALVDATLAPVWNAFAAEVSNDVARELERIARRHAELRINDVAALRLGGEPGTGAWSRDLARGIASTIVLGAVGGPAASFVAAVAKGFASRPHGTYMKRELGADLATTLLPAFEGAIAAFTDDLAARLGAVYDDAAAVLERVRALARGQTLGPIERARVLAGDAPARHAAATALTVSAERLRALETDLAQVWAAGPHADAATTVALGRSPAAVIAFDSDAYDRALRPERYRVVLLGALRRGKSSLINAIAGTRLLHDDAAREVRFPVHVRYGSVERAYALASDGGWREITMGEAAARAAQAPVLIEVPWTMPRELVIVHAPAFDSGSAEAESIAFAAARNASEVLGLFSRQLSDRELALYERVAELPKPMLLAHTIADNESASERRTVVELAGRYVRERGLPVARIFTISALDYLAAVQGRHAAAPWNELGALRETLHAHAEEHMRRALERQRMTELVRQHPKDHTSQAKFSGTFARLFGRR